MSLNMHSYLSLPPLGWVTTILSKKIACLLQSENYMKNSLAQLQEKIY